MDALAQIGLADAVPEPLVLIDLEGKVLDLNAAARRITRLEPGVRLEDAVEDEDSHTRALVRRWARAAASMPATVKWRGQGARGLNWTAVRVPGVLGKPSGVLLRGAGRLVGVGRFLQLARELEKQRDALRALHASRAALSLSHAKLAVTLESIGDAVITTDIEGRVDFVNPVAEQLTGWSPAEAIGRPLSEVFSIINEFTRKPAPNPVAACLAEGRTVGLANNTALIARDGSEYIIEDSAAPIRAPDGTLLGAVLVFRDATGARLARRQLEYLAHHDTLTGLHNRYYFEQQVEQALHLARRAARRYAMLYIDLDRFKAINDTAGHSVGDEVLSEIGQLFARRARRGDVLARLGGDEFGLLLADVDAGAALAAAKLLLQALAEHSFSYRERRFRIGASIGVALVDPAFTSTAEVLRRVDIACYVAKHSGRNRIHLYDPADEGQMDGLGELHRVSEIKDALAHQRLELHFQPIVPLHPNEQARAFEVLVRLRSRDGHLMLPGRFLPTAERYGLMPSVDRYVVENTFRLLDDLHRTGEEARFSVNLSATSLGDPELLELIKRRLRESDVAPGSLIFEITETAAVTHMDKAGVFIQDLQALGCGFALDDFGTGFSSFAYLKYLPVDHVKIDGVFVRDVVTNTVDRQMVRSINQIAHALNKRTVAEFVESEDVLDCLREVGVDYVQGYHTGRPAPWAHYA
ncbi:EAL domain-containing protein [Ectothiorhodospiraceae bacterium 2226]|nr:EAL domain-containing protein [Ectothiorhodospiraceae bacterium 2226]